MSTPEIVSLFGVVLAMVWALYREIRLGRTEVVQLVNTIRAEVGEALRRRGNCQPRALQEGGNGTYLRL